MIEREIIIEKNKTSYLNRLKESVTNFCKNRCCVLSDFEDKIYHYFSIAVEDELENNIDILLKREICNIYINHYKYDYFQQGIKFEKIDESYRNVFVKALVQFDKSQDEEYILDNLEFKSINISSFLHFRLHLLKERWDELIYLTNENSIYLLSSASFIELLKFLIKNLEVNFDVVNIYVENSSVKLKDERQILLKEIKLPRSKVSANILQLLIEFSAKQINVYANYNLRRSLKVLNKIYENKINFYALPK